MTGGEGGRQKGEIGEGMKGRSGDMEEETLWTSGLVNLVEKDMLTEVQEEKKRDVLPRRYNPIVSVSHPTRMRKPRRGIPLLSSQRQARQGSL